MESVDAMEEYSYVNRTPQPRSSSVTISDAMNAFSELHLKQFSSPAAAE